jgi:apolipoprotein N-acyltransferase
METAQVTVGRSARSRCVAAPQLPIAIVWWRSTWALAWIGQLFFWTALPPLELAPLAWLAPIPWVLLVRQTSLSGRRPYRALWLSAFAFNLAALYWVTLPHWATSFGLLALAFYLALYFPLFVGLSRVAVHRLGISPLVAAPTVWAGLELARGHLLTGFGMAALGHTQFRLPLLLQISDLTGGYGVSFVLVLVAASVASALPWDGRRWRWWPLVPGVLTLAGVLGYGTWRLQQELPPAAAKIALIQGSIDIEMKHDPRQGQRIFDEYFGLSRQAVEAHPDVELIVWPETMFRYPWFRFDKDFVPPPGAGWTPEQLEARSRQAIQQTVAPLGKPFLLGIDTVHQLADRVEHFNTALFTDGGGNLGEHYDKCHLVPFGEYVFLADIFPWLYRLTPLEGGLNRGQGPQSSAVGKLRYSPNICYENTVPHLIRGQVAHLRAEGREPDVLVNLTNDGWFWGSTELDMHLACSVFRAIECRKPMLVAANTGFSAWVDSNGRIQAQGKRRATDVVIALPAIDPRRSGYLAVGDAFASLCLVVTVGLALAGWGARWRDRKNPATLGT